MKVDYTNQFKKDRKRVIKQGLDVQLLYRIIMTLCIPDTLPIENKDHALVGNWSGYRECHIQPDWLLIYKVNPELDIITFVRTGSHGDLF